MRVARRSALFLLLICLIAAGPCLARDLVPVTDSELDAIHARGLDFLFDANTLFAGGAGVGGWSGDGSSGNMRPINVSFQGQNNLSMANSILLSGSARQSGLGVVNAVNSSVNMPINITILINSQVSGGINLSNLLSAIRH